MAAPPCASSSLLLLCLSLLFLLQSAASQSAPSPSPSGPINITGILAKAGQYTFFIGLLNQTQAAVQIDNQANNSQDGMTVFAPTDNAFNNLPTGTLNNLTFQQQVQLVQYHVCPKFYTLESFDTVSNPVRTEASGQDGKAFGLYITARANQVNVSTGIVTVPVYNTVRKDFPLAVFEVDQVLLPKEFYEASAPAPAPPAAKGKGSGAVADGGGSVAPSTSNIKSGAGEMGVGIGLVSVIWVCCMGYLLH